MKGLPVKFAQKAAEILHSKQIQGARPISGLAKTMTMAAKISADNNDENKRRVARSAAAAGVQSRGRRFEQLVAEHKEEIMIRL